MLNLVPMTTAEFAAHLFNSACTYADAHVRTVLADTVLADNVLARALYAKMDSQISGIGMVTQLAPAAPFGCQA